MKHLYLVLFGIFISGQLFAQQTTMLSGIVKSSGNEVIEGYTVVLLNATDSLSITWSYSKTEAFQLTYDAQKHKNTILYLSSFGYKDIYVNIEPEKSNLGTITLEPQTQKIDEVVVKGYSSVSHNFIRGKDEFSIPTSIAERETSLYSLLRQIPGLDVSGDNAVKIIGTGSPVFTINGLTPRPGELSALEPDRIDKVVINRMPSAKFDKNVFGVIDIITKKSLRDYLSVRVTDTFKQTDLASNNASVQINSKVGRWSNFISYGNDYSQSRLKTDYRQTIYATDAIYQQNTFGDQYARSLSHNILFSPKIELTKKSFIDLQYSFSRSDSKGRRTHMLDFVERELDHSNGDNSANTDNHNLILRYYNRFSNNSGITMNVGYSNYTNADNFETTETIIPHTEESSSSLKTVIDSKFNSQTATASIDYDFVLFKKLDINIGGRYAMLMNNSHSFYPITSTDYISERKESQAALYLSISQGWKKFSYQIGLREEYRYVHHAANKNENKNPYDFMPSLGFSYKVNDKINMTLFFRRNSTYPRINQLSPTISYINKYQYYTGNPNLKPSTANMMSYRLALPKNFSINLNYSTSDNQIIQMDLVDSNDETKTYSSYINTPRESYFSSTIDYWQKIRFYTIMASFSYTQCLSRLQFQNELIRGNDPDLFLKVQNMFTISKNIYALITLRYNSPYDSMIYRTGEEYSLDAGVNFSLLKKKLRIFIQGQNLLYRNSNIRTKYGQIYTNNTNIFQRRSFQVNITYNFNNFKDLFKKNDSNSAILERVQ